MERRCPYATGTNSGDNSAGIQRLVSSGKVSKGHQRWDGYAAGRLVALDTLRAQTRTVAPALRVIFTEWWGRVY